VVRSASTFPLIISVVLLLVAPSPGRAQGLPDFAPINPISTVRSGLYFQPFQEPEPGRWVRELSLDYGSLIEYNPLTPADYVLDTEVLRLSFGLRRDLGRHLFLSMNAAVGGSYGGFMDGFLEWYHSAIGIRMAEREQRPENHFLYLITLPDGSSVRRASSDLFLEDTRLGLGIRYNSLLQTVFSMTLPTSTGPDGYGRGVPSYGLMNTLRVELDPRVVYEGSLGVGYTQSHGDFSDHQRESFVSATSGLRLRVWGRQSLYANVFYHSPYYFETTLPSLDRRDLSLDFGWILRTRHGPEWRIGMTEDLEPGGPAVDLIFRFGRTF
jgi:uncharacterized protein DUF3187